MGNIYITY